MSDAKEDSSDDGSGLLSLVHLDGFDIVESKAAAFIRHSSFPGVPVADDSLAAAEIEEGLSGIAAVYTDEK